MIEFPERRFEDYAVGQKTSYAKRITDAEIAAFAALSGDVYPLHTDDAYAARTRFKGRIAHGLLTASLLSTANALMLGLPGGIYVSQSLRFRAPVYPGDTITATAEVIEVLAQRRRIRCRTTCVNQRGETVLDGEAVIQKDDVGAEPVSSSASRA
ncbi:MAG TPA: MaoC family dehydratase [Candidatus Dormibacteraeota bacterium]|nr:MaoC family dehydratase [Candidatus Dormibacteraeota bacterium]